MNPTSLLLHHIFMRTAAMKCVLLQIALITYCLHHTNGKILRNNALMSKMVSNFHKDIGPDVEPQSKVLGLMQRVLCKNFPSVPCDMILGDPTLKHLIERSIQQLKYKKYSLEKTTATPGYQLTLFPIVNSEELSNYRERNNRVLLEKEKWNSQHTTTPKTNVWSRDETKSRKVKNKRTAMFKARKNIRKFYPHKIKYKDKNVKDFVDYSGEKLSMSVEIPDMTLTKKHEHYNYRREPDNPPVWRIDYTKHGEPTLNQFAAERDQLKTKLLKTGPSVIVDENILENVGRKDVMHNDVYIKKTLNRNTGMNMNSGAIVD